MNYYYFYCIEIHTYTKQKEENENNLFLNKIQIACCCILTATEMSNRSQKINIKNDLFHSAVKVMPDCSPYSMQNVTVLKQKMLEMQKYCKILMQNAFFIQFVGMHKIFKLFHCA